MNKLVENKRIVRIEAKPFYYLSQEYLSEKGIEVTEESFSNIDQLFMDGQGKDFSKLVGHQYSLKQTVNKCKATISYPPNGLPMLLYGPTGTGKSFIAKLTYEWAINNKILPKKGRFVTVNCSEYANNPELLTANLFGHVKGAFTGADKDNEGLISLADGGVLFLDEVHELKAECQEKLFTYMDQGLYHRVGDNEKWYSSNARIIFATTENPENVLLKTLMRRIPMVITIPALDERTSQERRELIYSIFCNEQERLNAKIRLSNQVYSILMGQKFSGNVGEIKGIIQSSCINSLLDKKDDIVTIRLNSLPEHLLKKDYKKNLYLGDNEFIFVDELKSQCDNEKEIIRLNDSILSCYKDYLNHKNVTLLMKNGKKIISDYFDSVILKDYEVNNSYYLKGMDYILDIMDDRYGFKVTNNERIAIAYYIQEVIKEFSDYWSWYLKNEEECEDLHDILQNEYYRTTNIAFEICRYLKSYFDIDLLSIVIDTFIFYIYNPSRIKKIEQKACVILSHGYSTASSMAEAANQLLGEYIFDSLDMPINVDTQTIIDRLNSYLNRMGNIKDIYLLVDMGSLSEIYSGLNVDNVNVGIIDHVSTPIALEIGNGIRQGLDMDELLKKVSDNSLCTYHVVERKIKKSIILCSCASGIETSNRLKDILVDSLPSGVNIEVKIQDYSFLLTHKNDNPLFTEYNVLFMIGTLNPGIEGLDYVGVDDLIIQANYETMNSYFHDLMTKEELNTFNTNIVKNFSLSNLMNVLTILNPTKLLEQVANAIDQLQMYLRIHLSNQTCFGLYIHICSMIERLIIAKGKYEYEDCEEFEKENSKFIGFAKKALYQVEKFYHVEIPLAEIKYIYLYVKNDENK
ncbi:MAG: sigma 54-interacting transcriptional regulator [Bacillota bacterium]|nr:sigma 54-interacting transcriptional regulator [Bacillota bacterium]